MTIFANANAQSQEKYSVACFLGFQIALTSSILMFVVWFSQENRLGGIEAFAWVYNDSHHWFWPAIFTVALTSLFTMYVICRLPFSGASKKRNVLISSLLLFVYLLFSTCWLLFFLSLAGGAICDPVVRMLNPNTNEWEQWPHSKIDAVLDSMLNEDEVAQDIQPELRGVCLADTQYTRRGQRLVTLSVSLCLISYSILGVMSLVFQRSASQAFFRDFYTTATANAILVFGIGTVIQIVLDDDEWDWRVFNGLLISFLVSLFCVSSVLFFDADKLLTVLVGDSKLHQSYGRGLWIYHLVWIYVQILYDVEIAIYQGVLQPYSSATAS